MLRNPAQLWPVVPMDKQAGVHASSLSLNRKHLPLTCRPISICSLWTQALSGFPSANLSPLCRLSWNQSPHRGWPGGTSRSPFAQILQNRYSTKRVCQPQHGTGQPLVGCPCESQHGTMSFIYNDVALTSCVFWAPHGNCLCACVGTPEGAMRLWCVHVHAMGGEHWFIEAW